MRITNEGSIHGIRFTVFSFQDKFSLKLEKDLNEQIYKFRDGTFADEMEIMNYIHSPSFSNFLEIFAKMSETKVDMQKPREKEFDGFDEIL